ncbi:MAG: hypothetical protein E6K80_08715 [Candidatus Eisenbacteria bacterium]|uniref:EfeO-type cupredoxin-like domain-containing protein n=1 Tax=Eiseniibacteriota bacterium TaxID=2212470 RepID=A0A538U377_UNCEI|nr:MAG: hypothetical protein E6K80_08715 [Candidatus Eisenbacteria bacterium]
MRTRKWLGYGLMAAIAVLPLVACNRTHSNQTAGGEVHVDVTDKGFEPADVIIPAAQPVTLVMTRKTDQTCAKSVEFASLQKSYPLPLNQPIRIELPASQKGVLSYECGMHMLTGRVIVQ